MADSEGTVTYLEQEGDVQRGEQSQRLFLP